MNLEYIRRRLAKFAADRNWDQYHTPKNLSMALAAETAELLEIFQWLTDEQSKEIIRNEKEMAQVRQEIADVMIYLVRLADKLNIDIEQAVLDKIELNEKKYPVELSKDNAIKYNKRSERISDAALRDSALLNINELWNNKKEDIWRSALRNYWRLVKPTHVGVEKEFDSLDASAVKAMNPEEWYEFLLHKYFRWKYTAPNRYMTTSAQLKQYETRPDGLSELFSIKKRIFSFNKQDIASGLKISCSIKGLGTAGASGLLAVLFPTHFGTVDQFAVDALRELEALPERQSLLAMNPKQLKIKDAVILISIMRNKAQELNRKFMTFFWTPRKIDMILWAIGR